MRVFLGGTVAGSTWRNYMMPKLEVDYFNPVVEEWTPADQDREIFEREHCDFCLYVLSPKMIGWYSIAEVVDDSYKRPDKTVFCYLPEDDDKKFTTSQILELEEIGKIVTANGAIIKNTLDDIIQFLNSANKRSGNVSEDETIVNDVFISYGRRHSLHFATNLHNKLVSSNYKVWFDQNDIPLGVDFQQQIDDGIRRANNFVFIISPHSVKSIYCLKEVVLALKYNKRIIPILHVDPKDCWNEMHPEIEKLNWIYFREKEDFNIPLSEWTKIDDFEKAFAGLINLMEEQKEYVYQHTSLLDKALRWEAGQKRTSFLLIGNERKIAEEWLLKKEFKNKKGVEIQPPAFPTNLHAEYICESRKNAENLMTDVFFSYEKSDIEIKEKIQNYLHLNYFTTWSDSIDIKYGQSFEKMIERGIEEATCFLFIISGASLKSTYCVSELQYAIKLKKRIISVLIEDIDTNLLPASLRNIEYIDFIDRRESVMVEVQSHADVEADVKARKEKSPFLKGMDSIIMVLSDQRAYFEQHKIYLVQALKWERQKRNPSILLRGYNLENARTWLKIGLSKRNKPSKIHREFIGESEAKSGLLTSEIFISYSRIDSDFARKLNDDLQMSGKTTWFDQESIASSTDFQKEIFKGIEISNNFLFISSKDSVISPFCRAEIEYAKSHNKRIIVLLLLKSSLRSLPETLGKIQAVNFEKTDYHTSYSELLRTLDTDREHVQKHTRYAQDALFWEENNKDEARLLRGKELVLAESWLVDSKSDTKNPKIPAPTPLQIEFIETSKKAQEDAQAREREQQNKLIYLERQKAETAGKAASRQRFSLIIVTLAMIIAIVFGFYGFSQQMKAKKALDNLEIEQFNKYNKIAEDFYDKEMYTEAISNYKEALYFRKNDEIVEKINSCKLILKQKDVFDAFYDKGIELFEQGYYIESILELKKAEKLNYKSKLVSSKIKKFAEIGISNCKKTAQKMGEIRLYYEQKYYKAKADTIKIIAKEFLDK